MLKIDFGSSLVKKQQNNTPHIKKVDGHPLASLLAGHWVLGKVTGEKRTFRVIIKYFVK